MLLCEGALGEQHELLHVNLNMHIELPYGKHRFNSKRYSKHPHNLENSVIALGHKAPPRSSYVEIESGLKVPKGRPENTLFQVKRKIFSEQNISQTHFSHIAFEFHPQ